MYISNYGRKNKKLYFLGATISSILLLNDETIIRLSHENSMLWLVYIIIKNLNSKT